MGLRVSLMLASFIYAARIYAKNSYPSRTRASKISKFPHFSKFGALGSGKRKIPPPVLGQGSKLTCKRNCDENLYECHKRPPSSPTSSSSRWG